MKNVGAFTYLRGSGLGLLASLSLAAAGAAETTTQSTAQQGEMKNYTDQGQTTTTVYSSWSSAYPYNYYSSTLPMSSMDAARITVQHRPIYFPPTPPALGQPVPKASDRVSLSKFAAPTMLAGHVFDLFYAPLSTLLFTEDMDRRRREKLDGYRAARAAARDALHAKLEALQSADPETRRRELGTFAEQQAPALAALEATAEEIRFNYVNGTWIQSNIDWNDGRGWRLGEDTRWESRTDEIKVITGATFFQDGLTIEQRLLLREIAMELTDSAQSPISAMALDAPGPFFYFTPSTARITLPAVLAPELETKVTAYRQLKSEMKNELRKTVYKQEQAFFESSRFKAMKALAEKQAPQFAALEKLAEEIRVGLVGVPNPARPPELPMSKELAVRISDYLKQKSEWQKEMLHRLEALKLELPDDRIEFTRVGGGYRIEIVPRRQANAETLAKRDAANAALTAFNARQEERFTHLMREKQLIATEVQKLALDSSGGASGKSIDRLLVEFTYALQQMDRWERYTDYDTAVLQPGLSPAQRRLLFAEAIEKLELPLVN